MLRSSCCPSKSQSSSLLDQNENTKQEARAKAQARKEHMMALQIADQKKQQINGSSHLYISESKAKKIRREAQEKIHQNEDIVKLLNTYSQRAVAFAIRDKQIMDKEIKEKEERDYERRMDLAMELDRLKELKLREETEAAKAKKRVEDRKVIEEQIEIRRQQRILQEEEREQENQQMLSMIRKYQAESETNEKLKKEQAKAAQIDVIRRNEEFIERKKKQVMLAKEEDQKIIAYQKQYDEKMRQRELDEIEERKRKELLQKKMLASQTKSIDKQAQLDELRARRAMEEKERLHRQKELYEAQKRKRDMQILHEARKRQEDERQQKIDKDKSIKNDEYDAAIKLAADMAKREKDEERATIVKNEAFRAALQKQIEDDESKRKAKEKEKRDEGRQLREKRVSESFIKPYAVITYCYKMIISFLFFAHIISLNPCHAHFFYY